MAKEKIIKVKIIFVLEHRKKRDYILFWLGMWISLNNALPWADVLKSWKGLSLTWRQGLLCPSRSVHFNAQLGTHWGTTPLLHLAAHIKHALPLSVPVMAQPFKDNSKQAPLSNQKRFRNYLVGLKGLSRTQDFSPSRSCPTTKVRFSDQINHVNPCEVPRTFSGHLTDYKACGWFKSATHLNIFLS